MSAVAEPSRRQPLLPDHRLTEHPPARATPVVIPLMAGVGNFVSNNDLVAIDVHSTSSDFRFSAQVSALLTTEASDGLAAAAVMVDAGSTRNTILHAGGNARLPGPPIYSSTVPPVDIPLRVSM